MLSNEKSMSPLKLHFKSVEPTMNCKSNLIGSDKFLVYLWSGIVKLIHIAEPNIEGEMQKLLVLSSPIYL